MIFLDIKGYCQKCNYFEADVEKPKTLNCDGRKIKIGDFIVRCKHRDICERMSLEFSHPNEEDLK